MLNNNECWDVNEQHIHKMSVGIMRNINWIGKQDVE